MVRRSRNLSDAVDLAVIDKDAAIFAIWNAYDGWRLSIPFRSEVS